MARLNIRVSKKIADGKIFIVSFQPRNERIMHYVMIKHGMESDSLSCHLSERRKITLKQ